MSRPSPRKVFEALYRAAYLQGHSRLPDELARDFNNEYAQSGPQIAWEIWQAAHAHALEMAAQICEQRQASHINQESKAACRLCAGDIRSMLEDAQGDGV
ncbi:hypothetical protein [Paraburkholderia sp. J67]|uniref:hypothetical protein n=1 Tax=Paraburkholderia sp. J67 TaxID=2805435 RepID=UPI002ABD5622|nr:hypothetical protein [Paraburkholderia sp. J67]